MDKRQLEYLFRRIDILEQRVKTLETKQSLEQHFTVQEVADSLALTPITIVRKIHEGEIQAIRIGKEFRISKQEVENYLLRLCEESKGKSSEATE